MIALSFFFLNWTGIRDVDKSVMLVLMVYDVEFVIN